MTFKKRRDSAACICKDLKILKFRDHISCNKTAFLCFTWTKSQRFQPYWIFSGLPQNQAPCPKVLKYNKLVSIKAFSSMFEENPKFLFFHSPKNLFIYKLISYSTASSIIFKYFKSQQWCLLKKTLLDQCFFTLTTSSQGLKPLRIGPAQRF